MGPRGVAAHLDDNHLLALLTSSERQRWFGALGLETLARGRVLVTAGDPLPMIWLPVSGLVMLEHLTPDGARLELGAVGREGLIGTPGALGDVVSPCAAVVRVAGHGYRLRAKDVAEVFRRHAGFQQAVLAYLGQAVTRMAQAALCFHAHPILDRLAGWLLAAEDSANDAVIEITQDELSSALGRSREVVSRAINELVRAEAVWRQPQRILVLDRARLEATSCGCYWPTGASAKGDGRLRTGGRSGPGLAPLA